MSETKFTKGPWSAFCVGSTVAVDIGPKPTGAGTCIVSWPGFDSCNLPLREQKANAHLIAAAPELYEALEELVDLMEGVRTGDYTPDSFTNQVAHSALAKARGETQ